MPVRRASLSGSASPTLQAAGASLAASFLEAGLAGGDAAVLDRLMALLAAPLAPCFYRAPTDNDKGGSGGSSYAARCGGGPWGLHGACRAGCVGSPLTHWRPRLPTGSAPPLQGEGRRAGPAGG